MNFLRLPLILLMTGVLGLAGCSVRQPTALYQLDSGEPGQPKQSTAIVLASDLISRAVAFPVETPAGVVTALIGAPFFLFLARRAL